MKTSTFPTHKDLEDFAEKFLGVDYDDFYELYYHLQEEDEDKVTELTQTKFEF
jgi:hypothetical protein